MTVRFVQASRQAEGVDVDGSLEGGAVSPLFILVKFSTTPIPGTPRFLVWVVNTSLTA